MAVDWMQMEKRTINKPEVHRIASILKINRYEAFGRLFAVWTFFDDNSTDGIVQNTDRSIIDALADKEKFADAMIAVGWLREEGNAMIMTNFLKHNGESAKARALTQKRVASKRARDERNASRVTANSDDDERAHSKARASAHPNDDSAHSEGEARADEALCNAHNVTRVTPSALQDGSCNGARVTEIGVCALPEQSRLDYIACSAVAGARAPENEEVMQSLLDLGMPEAGFDYCLQDPTLAKAVLEHCQESDHIENPAGYILTCLRTPKKCGITHVDGIWKKPKGKKPPIKASDFQTQADILKASARRCSIAWRKTVAGRKRDGLELCDETFRDMLHRQVPEKIIIERIGTRRRRGKLDEFCTSLETELGMTPQSLYARPMTDPVEQAKEENDFDAWKREVFAPWKVEFVSSAPGIKKTDTAFVDGWAYAFFRLGATPDEMSFATSRYVGDERRMHEKSEIKFVKSGLPFLKRYITDNRLSAKRADLAAAHEELVSAGADAPATSPESPPAPLTDPLQIAIRNRVGESRFGLWFLDKTRIERIGGEGLALNKSGQLTGMLQIGVANQFLQDWIRNTFRAELAEAAAALGLAGFRTVIDPALAAEAQAREQRQAPAQRQARGAGPGKAAAG